MRVSKPTEKMLIQKDRVQQFWKKFLIFSQNEKTLGWSAGQSSLNAFQNRKLTVSKRRMLQW